MQKQIKLWGLALALIAVMVASASAQQWAIKGDYADSCSCNSVCPCLFGSSPTLGHCEGNSLVEIKKGHYGDVHLDGISMVYALRFPEWVKYYVSEKATDEQAKAAVQLMTAVWSQIGVDMKVLSSEKVPVSIKRTETKVKYSVPDSTVEIEMMKGRDGKPILIKNIPFPFTLEYTQYKSITNNHQSKDKEFSYSGTNGFTAKFEATSEK